MSADRSAWWKNAVVYQVYPKSFADGNGDGIGDLPGLIEKLPYLQDLGAGIVWLSPIFASPMIDNGYDVTDFKAVNPLFGSERDADRLFEEAHKRGLKIVLDIALNHTSTAHPWFQNAQAGGDKRDWYLVRPARNNGPPNNWLSVFGGPAWSPIGKDWYLHLFDKTQADLNWDNPEVRAAIHDAMRFWLGRGASGFRLDVVTVISKPEGLPDLPDPRMGPLYRALADGPHLHAYLREMRQNVFDHFDCVAIGEAPGVDPARAAQIVDPADPMLDMIYHFDLVDPPRDEAGNLDRVAFKGVFSAWDKGIGARGWNSVVLSNHDLARIVSRFGDAGRFWRESASMLLALVLLQRGTPFVYQGDEIGMTNAHFATIDELDDVWAKTTYRLHRERGAAEADAFAAAVAMTRDHARTPFTWSAGPHAGFSPVKPWLHTVAGAAGRDAEAQARDPSSVLAFAKALIALRRDPLFVHGTFEDLAPLDPNLFVFRRAMNGQSATVLLNLSPTSVPTPPFAHLGRAVLSNYAEADASMVRPFEASVCVDT